MPKMNVRKKEKKAEKRKKLKQPVAQKEELELESEPKEKKQNLQAAKEEEELTAEERRKLERKLKKERKKKEKQLMREAGISTKKVQPKKPSGSELALAYLTSWSEKPEEWKFQKTRQTWLLLHMYDKEKVPDKYFTILLDYLQGLQGSARDITVQKAEAFMKEFDGSNAEDPDLLEKCDVFSQKRLTTSMPCSDTVTGMEFSAAVSRLAAVVSLSVLLLMVRQQLRGCSCTAGRWLAGGCGGCTQCQSPSEAQRYIKLIFQCKKLVKRVCNKDQYY